MENRNYKNPVAPGLPELLDARQRHDALAINCVQVGVIKAFNHDEQTATIEIALKQTIVVNTDGSKVYKEYPVLARCPVMILSGGGSYLSMPIAPGDNCLVLFSDKEIDNWFSNGPGQPTTSNRIHDLSDGIAIVGLFPLTKSIGGYLAAGIRMFFNSLTKIELTNNLISSVAALFTHTGNMKITGDLFVEGNTYGNDGTNDWNIHANIRQAAGYSMHAGNGATGTFSTVTVVDGIVVSGVP